MIQVKKNEATASLRRMYFHCVDVTDGLTPETGEAGGQPQISYPGAEAFSNTGIGTLAHMGNGRYYTELTQAICNIADRSVIEGRYKSANTAEAIGTTVQIIEFPVDASVADLPTLAEQFAGGLALETTLETVASYIDTEITTLGERLNNVGGLTGAHTVTVQFYRTATTTPIPDVNFDVYDSTETARANGTQLKSAINGQMSFSRDNGTYKVRAMLAGFTFTTGTVVVADGNETLIMYGAAITIPNPPVAGTQTLFGNVRELDWGVSTGDIITAVIADKGQVVNGTLIQHLNLSTTVDANSQFSLTVPKGAVIRLTVKDHGTHEITINQEDTYDVATYLTEG